MARKYFGTDGVRGTANAGAMTADMVLKIGMAAGSLYQRGSHRHRVVIGKDTRLSGYMIEQAFDSGASGGGHGCVRAGAGADTGGCHAHALDARRSGVMISASHNPYQDNGIKIFGPDGYKLVRRAGTADRGLAGQSGKACWRRRPDKIGRATRIEDARARYIEFAKRTFPRDLKLDGLRVVIDTANGAAYKVAPTALWELGAEIIQIGHEPDGMNINRSAVPRRRKRCARRCVSCAPTSASRSTATPTG